MYSAILGVPCRVPLRPSPRQHELRDEAEARILSHKRAVDERETSAVGRLENEEDAREAARREDQMAGPWGFLPSTSGNYASRTSRGGTQDGLGIFGVSAEDDDFHGFRDGGKKTDVGDAELRFLQPLQQAAHEER